MKTNKSVASRFKVTGTGKETVRVVASPTSFEVTEAITNGELPANGTEAFFEFD